MAAHVRVIVENAQEVDAIGVGERVRLGFQRVALRPVADDPEGAISVGGHSVERFHEGLDVRVFDQLLRDTHPSPVWPPPAPLYTFGLFKAEIIQRDIDIYR
ncbi:hypothetical protein BN903_125 [Halorubrum sp. AJ67]|nr:hypothetical protein BN903_125 [Halorubrum sp. AJ67]